MTRTLTIICLALSLLSSAVTARADLSQRYTGDHPVVILSDWDFAPYEYLGESGKAEGYNIDLLNKILDNLGLPHVFVLNNWHTTVQDFEANKGALIVSQPFVHDSLPIFVSKMPFHYYKMAAATYSLERPLAHLDSLTAAQTMGYKNGDYAMHFFNSHPVAARLVQRTPREGLTDVVSRKADYYVWGEEPLKWKVRALHLQRVRLDSIDIPVANLHLIGYDQELISAIDDQYARLNQNGELQAISDKWFHPESTRNNTSYLAVVIVLCVFVAMFVVFLLSRLIKIRVRAAVERTTDLNHMMRQALSMGDYLVIVHDLAKDIIYNEHGHLLPDGGVSTSHYLSMLHPDDRALFHENLRRIKKGMAKQPPVNYSINIGTETEPDWQHLLGQATLEKEGDEVRYIVSTVKNITKDLEEERRDQEHGTRFFSLFDSNLIAMSFYDASGKLVNFNQQMKQLCRIDETADRFFRETNLFEAAMFKDQIALGATGGLQSCQHMYYPSLGIDTYIELKVTPYTAAGTLLYYVVAVCDVSHEREMHMALKRYKKELQQTNERINNYEHDLSFLLRNGDMYAFRTNNDKQIIYFTQSLQTLQYHVSFEQYVNDIVDDEREKVAEALRNLGNRKKPFNVTHHFHCSPVDGKPAWFSISATPVFDANGRLTGHFGVARDITKLMVANELLRQETKRAENSGLQKSAFLANMTHEIRTPLNAIVGFSDLLPMIDTQEERMEFIRIIRNNCDMLLRLINDILETSDIESRPLSVEPADVDFATVFDDICQTLAQRVQQPGVTFVKDNPYTTFPTRLDKGRMQQVITNFVTNAVKYTHQGHIRVGYRYEDGGILMYCEDTGAGIPKEKQAAVFERFVKLNEFVQGTGLGLAICKSIAKRCNGKIGVNSEGEGKGSTFWIWIPCPAPDGFSGLTTT